MNLVMVRNELEIIGQIVNMVIAVVIAEFTSHKSFGCILKVALHVLGQKLYQNTKDSSLCSKGLFIFIHKTLVVKKPSDNREN